MLRKNSDNIIDVRHPQNVSSQIVANMLGNRKMQPSMAVAGRVIKTEIMPEWTMYFVIFANDSEVLLSAMTCSLRWNCRRKMNSCADSTNPMKNAVMSIIINHAGMLGLEKYA